MAAGRQGKCHQLTRANMGLSARRSCTDRSNTVMMGIVVAAAHHSQDGADRPLRLMRAAPH